MAGAWLQRMGSSETDSHQPSVTRRQKRNKRETFSQPIPGLILQAFIAGLGWDYPHELSDRGPTATAAPRSSVPA